ncbi:MAG: dATP pyrophosphohydrolase [Ignavibacteria bacterium]|nr:dATP pyrophosphohydrolase [Ignavibacteria bacterium]
MPEFISNSVQVHVAAFDDTTGDLSFLLLQRSESVNPYPMLWQTITGWIEDGETALEAAIRELKEEVSLEPLKIWTLPYVANFFDADNDLVHSSPVFGILVDFKKDITISDEHQEFLWLRYKPALKKLMLPSHRDGLKIFKKFILTNINENYFLS